MYTYLIQLGFTDDQIKKYIRSKDYTLEELLNDTSVQIDSVIKRLIHAEMYEYKLNKSPILIKFY